jgi:acyl-CoA synthetase (NDP forming)
MARRHGMRMIGPNCLGLLNTDPAIRLNATFGLPPVDAGNLGLVSQSGALGIAVLMAAKRCGLGVSQFVSVGNKADISGNDLLLAWERDDRTSVIALYLESFGNPRKFSRIARRVSRNKPIIAIKAGRSAAGQRAGKSHTAAAASSDAVVDAMFSQAGVLRVDTMEQMLDVARVLSDQPRPAGRRLAIVGNSGGPGILAADAAEAAGLSVVELDEATTALVRAAAPRAASAQNPIDLGAGAQAAEAGDVVCIVLASDSVDMVLTVFTETLVANRRDVMAAIATAAAASDKLVAATQVGGEDRSVPMPGPTRTLPIFGFPEPAAAAMGFAWRYAQIASAPLGEPCRPEIVDAEGCGNLVAQWLAAGESWLAPQDVARLLIRYGIPLSAPRVVSDVAEAGRAAAELGYPVAVKLAGGTVHKTDVGGVRLGVADEAELRKAFDAVRAAGPASADVLIQPMAPEGTELIAGVLQDPQFGPLLMLGAGGVLADMIADRQFRLAPLTIQDADQMIAGMRTAPLLDGYRGRPVVSRAAVRELLLRLAALAEDLPEVAELDLNPVICSGDELVVVDAKVRIAPAPASVDPVLRQLRG